MRRLLAASLLLSLGGCAHLLPAQPAWTCSAEQQAGGLQATTVRTLDSRGRLLHIRSQWLRGFDLKPHLFILSAWVRGRDEHRAVDGSVTLDLVPEQRPAPPHRLELRSAASAGRTIAASEIGQVAGFPQLTLPWSSIARALEAGGPLYLLAVARDGAVLASERLDAPLFATGLRLVSGTDAQARAMAANFTGRCTPYQKIILT